MKYVAGGVAVALVTGLIVLLIRHEGDGLRQAVKQASAESIDNSIERAPETATKAAGRFMGRVLDPTASPADKTAKSTETNPSSTAPAAPTETAAPAQPTAKAEPPKSIDPVGVVGSLFETGRQAVKAADDVGQEAFQLDDKQAGEIGSAVHEMILRDHKVLDLPSQATRMRRLADPVIAQCKRKTIPYTFTILDDPTVNAFSHVGGYVYVHRGLLDLVANDAELQFVLAHEIGHVDLKHCERGLNYTAPLGTLTHNLAGQLALTAYHLIALGYDEELEFAADEFAFRNMIRLGRSRDDALMFSRHYLTYAREKGIETGKRKPGSVPGAVVQEVENHFRSHPPAEERLHRLEAIKL